MRPTVLPAVLAAFLASCGLPPNQPSVYGVAAYNASTGEFWVNGKPMVLPPDVPDWNVRSGDTVNAYYETVGDQKVVTDLDIVKRFVFGF